jgi:dolichol-phosphate mannosyltransferase
MNSLTKVRPPLDQSLISVVLPLYNESAVVGELVKRIDAALRPLRCRFEVIFVNDGSTDDSPQQVDRLADSCEYVRVVHFSRNFGHQPAVQAGLLHAAGDAVILMDSDLQDDPAVLPEMIRRWQDGDDVVYAVRFGRKEGPLKRLAFFSFYRLLNWVSNIPIPKDAGNFGLMDRQVSQQVAMLGDCDRYFPGLRSWVGFRQSGLPVERLARHDDQPRVTLRQLCLLAKAAVFGFSRTPLTLFYSLSLFSLLLCTACTSWTLYHKLITGHAIPGWTSITILASFFGALNALGIGVLGEYVVRIYDQVRARPQFVIARRVNFPSPAASDDSERATLHALTEQVRQMQQELGRTETAQQHAASELV